MPWHGTTEHFALPYVKLEQGRFATLEKLATQKRVLHIGCADAGLRADRHSSEQLLHTRLEPLATSLHGIDVSQEDIDALRQAGIPNLHVGDVCEDGWSIEVDEEDFELLVVSEVLEHVSNAGQFLVNLATFARAHGANAVFSVPSPFNPAVLRQLLSNAEFVHPDHNYWFSFQTATGLIEKHGWQIESVSTYSFDDPRVFGAVVAAGKDRSSFLTSAKWVVGATRGIPYRAFVKWLQSRSPFFADGLIITATPIDSGNAG